MTAHIRLQKGSCPNGGVFYSCKNGFEGCCLEDPCNPGATCPKEKDRTPGRDTPTASISRTPIVTSSPASTPTSTQTTQASPIASSSLASSVSATPTLDPVPPNTRFITIIHQPTSVIHEAKPNPVQIPVGAIIGTVLGALGLTALVLVIFICFRRQKVEKVYKASHYPSPYVGHDVSPQLALASKTSLRRSVEAIQQLDSREISGDGRWGRRSSRYAELPAESVRY